jgi:3-carboxy-cis,cis-muconate cycloisomerase
MSPSSSSSETLSEGLFARGEVAARTSDRAFLQAMLDVETALAKALVRAGLAPRTAAEELLAAATVDAFDLDQLGRSNIQAGTPVPGVLAQLRTRLGPGQASDYLHRGATSQDVVDTASMLVARRALAPLLADLVASTESCAELAERHRADLQAGRTLLQHAAPITFGLKAAGWLVALKQTRSRLQEIRERGLAVQLGGAVGTLAALGDRGLDVQADVARQLELAQPELPWHAARGRPARLACELGIAAGTMGKVARDLTLLAQTEVGEVSEGEADGRGASSTLPHKRNPVGAVAVMACAQRTPALVATVLAAMVQEHERAAGTWQAETGTLIELLRLTGSAAASLRETLAGLVVDPERMRANLEMSQGLVMSESAAMALATVMGWEPARRLVSEAARAAEAHGTGLREELERRTDAAESLNPEQLARALEPASYLGAASGLIDRALALHRAGGSGRRRSGARGSGGAAHDDSGRGALG